MSKRKFPKKDMQDMANDDAPDGYEIMANDIVDMGRWNSCHELVFKYDGKFWISPYQRGGTEQQDESPYEYDNDEIECDEVRPVKVENTVYLPV